MGKKTEKSGFVDLFELDHMKYSENNVEEIVDDTLGSQDVSSDKLEEEEEDLTPEAQSIGDAIGDRTESKVGDKKQTAEDDDDEEQEDALSNDSDDYEDEDQGEVSDLGSLMQELVNEGVLDFDDEKEYDLSIGGLTELINETSTKAATKAVESYKSKFGNEAKQLLDVLENGGSVNDFIQMNQQVDFSKVPLRNSKGDDLVQNQMYIVEDWLKVQGYEDSEIQEKVRELYEAGLISKEAERSQKKLVDYQKKQNESLIETRRNEKEKADKDAEKLAVEFKDEVLNIREIAGFKISKTKAEKLYDYITSPVGPNGETKFALDDDVEGRLLYAYFAMSGFDKSALSKEIATTQALKLKKGLSNFRDTNVSPRGGDQQVKRDRGDAPKINWAFA